MPAPRLSRSSKLTEPHILLAAANPAKMLRNLAGILSARELAKIDTAIKENSRQLYVLGLDHYSFAKRTRSKFWRQRTSRFYYAAYNIRRAIHLVESGKFSTDSSDHHSVSEIPDAVHNAATYRIILKNLRDDRNLADYDHGASIADLLIPPQDAESYLDKFVADAKEYLTNKGVRI